LRSAHETAFSTWLGYSRSEQWQDLNRHLSGRRCDAGLIVRTWLSLESYRMLVPVSASVGKRHGFLSDMEALLWRKAHGDADVALGPPENRLLRGADISRWLRVSCRTLCLWAQRQTIPAIRVGRQYRFQLADLQEWLRAREAHVEAQSQGCDELGPERRRGLFGRCAICCSPGGVRRLTTRELGVIGLIGRGKTTKEIAKELFISAETVREHRKNLCRKLGLHSTSELVACGAARWYGVCREEQLEGAGNIDQSATPASALGTPEQGPVHWSVSVTRSRVPPNIRPH
jgi:excisionase family DNA binding protein